MNYETCECGARVSLRGRAAHLKGNEHRCGLERVRLRREGYVPLAGTTAATVGALGRHGVEVRAFPYWSPGGLGTPGYESAQAGVRLAVAFAIATGALEGSRAAVEAAQRLYPLVGPPTLGETINATRGKDARAVLEDMRLERGEVLANV